MKRLAMVRGSRAVGRGLRERSCGTCTACCTALGVLEIDKPPCTPCKHLGTTKGCGIYETRPESCRRYHCMWRAGLISAERRPDRFGIVFDPIEELPNEILAREVRAGALGEAEVVRVLATIARERAVALIDSAGELQQVLGPPERALAVEGLLRATLPAEAHLREMALTDRGPGD